MFVLADLRALLDAKPFVPFRLRMSDSSTVDVRHKEFVLPGRRFAVIGIPDQQSPEQAYDVYTVVWYMHVARAEMLTTGLPPMAPSPGPSESGFPAPA